MEKKTQILQFYPPHAPPDVCMLLQFYVDLPTTGFKTYPQPVQSPPSTTSINAGYL
jgi:hypothetical protein